MLRHVWHDALIVSVTLLLAGCGVVTKSAEETAEMPADSSTIVAKSQEPPRSEVLGVAGEGVAATNEGLNRKIIYNAQVELAVEDFSGVPERIVELVKRFGAYVADSSLAGSTGETRRGYWKIRVPVERFEEFVGAAKGLGELIKVGTSSQDVSEEYYDVDARIRNKTKEEERLLKLLEERPGKLEDVIAIERELSRVRGELERMQGRLRVLADLTSLTTVEVTITEIRGYVPPEAPTLATRVSRTFDGSLGALKDFGERLLLLFVALAPWIPLFAAAGFVAYVLLRRLSRIAREWVG